MNTAKPRSNGFIPPRTKWPERCVREMLSVEVMCQDSLCTCDDFYSNFQYLYRSTLRSILHEYKLTYKYIFSKSNRIVVFIKYKPNFKNIYGKKDRTESQRTMQENEWNILKYFLERLQTHLLGSICKSFGLFLISIWSNRFYYGIVRHILFLLIFTPVSFYPKYFPFCFHVTCPINYSGSLLTSLKSWPQPPPSSPLTSFIWLVLSSLASWPPPTCTCMYINM